MSDYTGRVGLVEWEFVTLERLKAYKMKIGSKKHEGEADYNFSELFADILRKFAEMIISTGSGDHRDIMEAFADISNLIDISFPEVQKAYVEDKKGQPPDCFATEDFNSLQCRSEPCAWRTDCMQILGADLGKFLRSFDNVEGDRFSTRFE